MYIHRNIEQEIEKYLDRKEVISIIGPRQSGKTTLLNYVSKSLIPQNKKIKNITFENNFDLNLFNNDIESFKKISENYDVVIIDEFQYANNGGKNLKFLFDTTKTKFIISCSSSLELRFQTGKYMVGRLLEFQLLPFSFDEFLSSDSQDLYEVKNDLHNNKFSRIYDYFKGKDEIIVQLSVFLEKYCIFGGYPAVVLSKTAEEKEKLLEGIASNYLLREIKGLLQLATEDELTKLQQLLALQIGNMISYNELSDSANLTYLEIKKHINILEKTFIISVIRPYFTNKRTELVKNPKIYFTDFGLRNLIINDFRKIYERNDLGAIMENYAFNALKKYFPEKNIHYWRTKSKAEVDFVIEHESQIIPVEIKYSSKEIIGKSLHSFIEKFSPKEAYVFTKNIFAKKKIRSTTVIFFPLCCL